MELSKVKIAHLSDLPAQAGRVVEWQGREVAVFRLGNGDVCALENRCPHKNGPLAEGIVAGSYVFCPLHDWKIDLQDGMVQSPDTGCVSRYEVEVVGNDVYLLV